jgi:hypothetical protein
MDNKLLRSTRVAVAFLHQMVVGLAVAVLLCAVLAASGAPGWLVLAAGIVTAGGAAYAVREHRRFWKHAKRIGLDPWLFYREPPSRRQLLANGLARVISGQPVSEDRPAPEPRK